MTMFRKNYAGKLYNFYRENKAIEMDGNGAVYEVRAVGC